MESRAAGADARGTPEPGTPGEWQAPSGTAVREFAEKLARVTDDWKSVAGFRAKLSVLTQTQEGCHAVNAVYRQFLEEWRVQQAAGRLPAEWEAGKYVMTRLMTSIAEIPGMSEMDTRMKAARQAKRAAEGRS
jgi:hypothetical protein